MLDVTGGDGYFFQDQSQCWSVIFVHAKEWREKEKNTHKYKIKDVLFARNSVLPKGQVKIFVQNPKQVKFVYFELTTIPVKKAICTQQVKGLGLGCPFQ